MNDYLGTLAARSLGLIPVARPRLASRFEPDTNAAPPLTARSIAAEDASESTGPTPGVRDAHSVWLPVQQEPATPRTHETLRPCVHIRLTDVRESQEVVGVPASLAPSLVPPQPVMRPAMMHRDQPTPTQQPHQPAPALAETDRPVAVRPVDVSKPRESWDNSHRSIDPDGSRWREIDERMSLLERVRARPNASADPVHEAVSRPSATRSRDRERQQTPPAVSQSAGPIAAAETPAAVHVTIGRVDVRAIVPPVAPRGHRRPTPGPSLSLDEYLKQRSVR
jgi:hypothetical protein